jgi:hypothetical protein
MTAPATFVAWVLSILVAAAPPEKKAPEPEAEVLERYEAIATSIVEASFETTRPIFIGRSPRSHSMALMAAVAVVESGLRADVDRGEKRGTRGECTVFQLMPRQKGDCEAWLADRHLAAVTAHEMMARSRVACLKTRGASLDIMLAAYASGSCEAGLEESKARVTYGLRMYRDRPPPVVPPSFEVAYR